MTAAAKDSLWYLAPGLVHQLGNVLFAVQGRAQLLPAGADRDGIVDAARRAQHAVQVVRWLLGEGEPASIAAGPAVECLVELLRVPMRDAGLALACGTAGSKARVDATRLARLACAGCHAIAATTPPAGRLTLDCAPHDGEVALHFRYAAAPGSLPFPLAVAIIAEKLRAPLDAAGAALALTPGAPTLTIRWPVAAPDLPHS